MKFNRVTVEQMRQNESRSYNAKIWDEKIDRLASLPKCQFYSIPAGNGFDYERFFVSYQIEEGIILLNHFAYSSSITSNPFCVVTIAEDGEVKANDITVGEISGRVKNDKLGRAYMAQQSLLYGTMFSNCI